MQQTCAFDSLLQLVINGIATHEIYENETQSSSDCIFQLGKSILDKGKIIAAHYDKRASILQDLSLFRDRVTTYTRNIQRLNANCNVAHLAEYIFKNEPSCIFKKSCSCSETHSRKTIICSVNVDVLLTQGLQDIQHAINDMKNIRSNCRTCGVDNAVTYGKHIIIDTSILTDHTYTATRPVDNIKHDLQSVQKIITLNNVNYMLAGVAHYIAGSKEDDGHYIAFAYSGTHWYKYDDLQKKRAPVNTTENVNPHLIYYVKCT